MASYCEVPKPWLARRDACRTVLERNRGIDGTRLYAIMDLAAVSDGKAWHQRLIAGTRAQNLFQGQPEEAAQELAPWLIPMDGPGRILDLLERTVDEAVCSQAVCWLSSALDLVPLAKRLARRMTAQLPQGEALLRYYDPRLFAALWTALPPATQADFGAVGRRWWYLDADMALQCTELPGTGPMDDPWNPPLQCSAEQVRTLLDLSEQHQLAEFLGKRRPEDFLRLDRGQRLRFVARHDDGARKRHVAEFTDRLRYCELALEHGEDFAEQAQWLPVWQAMLVGGGVRLHQALTRRGRSGAGN